MKGFGESIHKSRLKSGAGWVKILIYAALLAALYHSILPWLVFHDWMREDYSHCMLIPIVVLYLIWEKKQALLSIPSHSSWLGFVGLILGIFLYWLGELGGELYTVYLSLWFSLVGLTWVHLGWRKIRVIHFAFFMLLTTFPLPQLINVKLTSGLKLISSQIGVYLLHLFGQSAYREGNIIDLGFTQLQVVDACSGLRYLFPLLVMGILLAYFYRAAMWKRLVLVFSTIPLTIVTNSLRIALTGIIYKQWGAATAEGFFHGFSGWLIFVVSLAVLLAEIWVLKRIVPGRAESFFTQPHGAVRGKERVAPRTSHTRSKSRFAVLQFVVAVVLLILTLGISAGVEFREKVPSSKPFKQFPLTVGQWEGARQYLEQKFITELDLSDYTMIDFKTGDGKHLDFYVAYYESQRKGESIHSPETCLPGSGWVFQQAGQTLLPLAEPGRSIRVNRAILEKSGYRQLAYFWFPARGRILTNAWEMKIYTFWDALMRQRTDGALVRLITPVLQGEQVEDAEKRLQEFTKQIVPILDQYIPR